MITGFHLLIYSQDADAVRALFRDVHPTATHVQP